MPTGVYIRTKEQIENLRLSNLGRKRSDLTRKNMSIAHMGKSNGPRSAEARKAISEGSKGKVLSNEHRKNISDTLKGRPNLALKGKSLSDERRKSMSEAHKGISLSEEHRKAIRISAQRGEERWNWQGGKSYEEYPREFNDIIKFKIRERDGHKCMFCGAPQIEFERTLDVHHIDYNKSNCAIENLITLCSKDNTRANIDRQKCQTYFESLMRQKYDYDYKKIAVKNRRPLNEFEQY